MCSSAGRILGGESGAAVICNARPLSSIGADLKLAACGFFRLDLRGKTPADEGKRYKGVDEAMVPDQRRIERKQGNEQRV